ncbi:MAG: hypothetical protein FWG69_00985 [Oscillospiraceae bacterium]|nr:hypothetical protein [Oscillospiraceae bacterium]
MRNFKIALKCVAFSVIFCFIFAAFIHYIDMPRATTRIAMHEFYTQDNIDIFFIGASRFRFAIAPVIIDRELGKNTYVSAAGSQTPIDNYYMLLEMYKYYTPELVVIDVSYTSFEGRPNTPAKVYLPEMKFSKEKLLYTFDAIAPSHYIGTTFPVLSSVNRIHLFSGDYDIWEKFLEKQSQPYKNYSYKYGSTPNRTYVGKGAVSNRRTKSEGRVGHTATRKWTEEEVDSKKLRFFHKAIELCKSKGTPVILLDAPTPLAAIRSQSGYAEYEKFVQNIADEHGVPFYNFGYVKDSAFERKDIYFYDRKHINHIGLPVFSRVIARFTNEYLNDTLDENEYFYSSYEETMAANPKIFNTWMYYNKDAKILTALSYHGDGVEPEYEFRYKPDEQSDYVTIQEYGFSDKIPVAQYDGGFIRVNCRSKGSDVKREQWDVYEIS